MKNEELKQKIQSLPIIQQVGLWVILKMHSAGSEKFTFFSSTFAEDFKPFAAKDKKANETEYGRFIGGVLSGLSRNNLLIKISGDRDKIWKLSDDVKDNYDDYKKLLFEIKTYWPSL